MESIIRIDPKSWQTEIIFPVTHEIGRLHGIGSDTNVIWQVCGTQDPKVIGYEGYVPGLVKYDSRTGKVLEIVDFVPGSCDMHDVTVCERPALRRGCRRASGLADRREICAAGLSRTEQSQRRLRLLKLIWSDF